MTGSGFKIADRASGVALQLDDGSGEITVIYAPENEPLALTTRLRVTGDRVRAGLNELCAGAATEDARRQTEMTARLTRLASRAATGLRATSRPIQRYLRWLVTSREDTNFTYDLSALNLSHLAATIAVVTAHPASEIETYLREPGTDEALKKHYSAQISSLGPEMKAVADNEARWARRLGWYAVVRAVKPKCVVETGVDKGHGALLLCAALARNAAEGANGQYIGTDINPAAGYLLAEPYAAYGKILFGDSIKSLQTLERPIDVFINDSDHSADYELAEYQTVSHLLGKGSIVIGDNAHVTDKLIQFANETGRRFLFFREDPVNHWYPGAGIGFAFN